MQDNYPTLVSCKPLKAEFSNVQEIPVTSENFTIGRGLSNNVVIPFVAISRNHCKLKKNNLDWIIEDHSSFGIIINGNKIGKGNQKIIKHNDIITFEATQEFIYKFVCNDNELMPSSKKRIKLDPNTTSTSLINDMKNKFEESQNYAIRHIEDKIHNTKQIKSTNILLKEQLQLDMKRKINHLESNFASQIENLKGKKDEVEKQKALLIEERDAQLAALKQDMEGRISELMEQIKKHNEIETELIKENNLLKEKMLKEREDFLLELNRESSLKQDMLDKLEAKMVEQEEVRLKEKQEFEELLKNKTELLKLEKEKELHILSEQKKQRECELMEELNNIKKNLEEQVERTEKQRCDAQKQLSNQMEEMKKAKNEDKFKMEKLLHEREEIQKRLNEAQQNSEKFIEELKARVTEREVELAALAAERIQKQAEQSSEVISSLQEQLEKVRSQLQNVESENKKLLMNSEPVAKEESTSSTLAEFGEIMESELQCSICAELFVAAITLNCSHTFCKYCITTWKKKKMDCPICRSPITSECRSLVLDSFIEKMVQNLTEEMKKKRRDMLKSREDEETLLNSTKTKAPNYHSRRRRRGRGRPRISSTSISSITGVMATSTNSTNQIPTVDLTTLRIGSTAPIFRQRIVSNEVIVVGDEPPAAPSTRNRPTSQRDLSL
ncbi:RING finger protein PFF0165c-like isoform X1 [Vanessa cardui]|uniref:RING finger protein PFF0165c-like isoform X1 n=1 Tax=Vanessa cardui TaxID=171605 RepID=UPI001F13F7CE|nr:RING finger protein PFF0165c-like isoform X1 [Vanessa cardui]XP_046962526.1 RING finger protein PFF0165c-like isoform X1 [Vanessa cardui]